MKGPIVTVHNVCENLESKMIIKNQQAKLFCLLQQWKSLVIMYYYFGLFQSDNINLTLL